MLGPASDSIVGVQGFGFHRCHQIIGMDDLPDQWSVVVRVFATKVLPGPRISSFVVRHGYSRSSCVEPTMARILSSKALAHWGMMCSARAVPSTMPRGEAGGYLGTCPGHHEGRVLGSVTVGPSLLGWKQADPLKCTHPLQAGSWVSGWASNTSARISPPWTCTDRR